MVEERGSRFADSLVLQVSTTNFGKIVITFFDDRELIISQGTDGGPDFLRFKPDGEPRNRRLDVLLKAELIIAEVAKELEGKPVQGMGVVCDAEVDLATQTLFIGGRLVRSDDEGGTSSN